jgi:hypothetical protein
LHVFLISPVLATCPAHLILPPTISIIRIKHRSDHVSYEKYILLTQESCRYFSIIILQN